MKSRSQGQNGVTVEVIGDDGITSLIRFVDHRDGLVYELQSKNAVPANGLLGLSTVSIGPKEDPFWPQLDGILFNCRRILDLYGHKDVSHPNDLPAEGSAPVYSVIWYAARIARYCMEVINARGTADASSSPILWKVMEIGRLYGDWNWRNSFEKPIQSGTKQRQRLTSLREAQNTKAGQAVARRKSIVSQLLSQSRRTGSALDQWIAQRLKRDHGIVASCRTIRRDRLEISKGG